MSLRSRAAIAGAGEADIDPGHGRSPLGLAAQASQRALADFPVRLPRIGPVRRRHDDRLRSRVPPE
jgi:hypothetical protein